MTSVRRHAPTGATGERQDIAEFEALFRRHYAPLCDFVHGYVRSREVACDLVQDLFLRLWEHAETPAATLAAAYLYTAARNRAIQHLRRQRVAARYACTAHLVEAIDSGPAEDAHERELTEALERAIAQLPDRCRAIFTLSRYRHLSNAEIAQALGISVNTVEHQMWRALKALRAKLASYFES
ncbi:MAG: RNA polymerase sigma-70 factor [Gemmatimonadales bacterium]